MVATGFVVEQVISLICVCVLLVVTLLQLASERSWRPSRGREQLSKLFRTFHKLTPVIGFLLLLYCIDPYNFNSIWQHDFNSILGRNITALVTTLVCFWVYFTVQSVYLWSREHFPPGYKVVLLLLVSGTFLIGNCTAMYQAWVDEDEVELRGLFMLWMGAVATLLVVFLNVSVWKVKVPLRDQLEIWNNMKTASPYERDRMIAELKRQLRRIRVVQVLSWVLAIPIISVQLAVGLNWVVHGDSFFTDPKDVDPDKYDPKTQLYFWFQFSCTCSAVWMAWIPMSVLDPCLGRDKAARAQQQLAARHKGLSVALLDDSNLTDQVAYDELQRGLRAAELMRSPQQPRPVFEYSAATFSGPSAQSALSETQLSDVSSASGGKKKKKEFHTPSDEILQRYSHPPLRQLQEQQQQQQQQQQQHQQEPPEQASASESDAGQSAAGDHARSVSASGNSVYIPDAPPESDTAASIHNSLFSAQTQLSSFLDDSDEEDAMYRAGAGSDDDRVNN